MLSSRKNVFCNLTLVLGLGLGLGPGLVLSQAASAKPAKPAEAALDARGEQLAARYQQMQEGLREQLVGALPELNERYKSAYLQACADEEAAKASLDEAEKALGEIGAARGLVGHARNHWIPKADRGIAQSREKLAAAKTQAERDAAQAELDNWLANRVAGVEALEQRTANYERLQAQEPALKAQLEAAQRDLAQAKTEVLESIERLRLDRVLTSDRLDSRLAKYVVLSQATPRGLAGFAQQGDEHQALVDQLLSNDALMVQMVVADGAADGNYGRAMQIYQAIQTQHPKAKDGVLQRLAVAISVEHATPIKQSNPAAATDAPAFIDPVARYGHYEQAYLNQELDPYFDRHSAWTLRFVVNGDEPDAMLAWGREMLRNYRPDHITTKDDRWRYVALVRTDVPYGSEEVKNDQPELQSYQNILMNGGICGRRAFIGRFILRSFGVPTVAKPQTGHAALARWTPAGWVPCLGAGWGTGWAPGREMNAMDFLELTQARDLGEDYLRVARAHWIGTVYGEQRRLGLRSGKGAVGFWNGVALNTQRQLIADAGTKTLDAVGEELGEATVSKVEYPFESVAVSEEQRRISVDRDGVITIPAAATSSPTASTGKIRFQPSVLGGQQLNYEANGRDQDFVYTFNAPKAGTYNLTMRVVSPGWKQHLRLSVKGAASPITFELPHTVGLWQTTEPIEIELVAGENVLTFSRQGIEHEVKIKGFAIRDFTLTPVAK